MSDSSTRSIVSVSYRDLQSVTAAASNRLRLRRISFTGISGLRISSSTALAQSRASIAPDAE